MGSDGPKEGIKYLRKDQITPWEKVILRQERVPVVKYRDFML